MIYTVCLLCVKLCISYSPVSFLGVYICLCCTQNNCSLTYKGGGNLGRYSVALQVEDFTSASSTVALSSVPVQFLVLVENITTPAGLTAPIFVGDTPRDGACIPISTGSTYHQQITAMSGGENAT